MTTVQNNQARELLVRAIPALRQLRIMRPLVHNITNLVVTNFTANILLAIGASPAMVHAPEEVEEFVGLAQALVVNIGTLSSPSVLSMKLAAREAGRRAIPWILDPVGVGATGFRNRAALDLAEAGPSVIRGNAGEIIALARLAGIRADEARQKGVDSLSGAEDALEAGTGLSRKMGAIVAITGKSDIVIDGMSQRVQVISGGHPMSQDVTGTGCAATAVIGACLAGAAPFEASWHGLALMKAAAEQASGAGIGPGNFATRLVDALFALTSETGIAA